MHLGWGLKHIQHSASPCAVSASCPPPFMQHFPYSTHQGVLANVLFAYVITQFELFVPKAAQLNKMQLEEWQ